MKIFLFGGAETGQARAELKMIEKVINDIKPKQLLHIPFARLRATEMEWAAGWFKRNIELSKGIEYLNARREVDVARAKSPLVFISGGRNGLSLIQKIKASPRLLKLIKNAKIIIGESKGASVLCKYFTTKGNQSQMIKALGIIKDTIIKPHYSQRQRQASLIEDMAKTGVKYGIGLDSITAIAFTASRFPKGIKKIGRGKFVIKRSPALIKKSRSL